MSSVFERPAPINASEQGPREQVGGEALQPERADNSAATEMQELKRRWDSLRK